MRSKNAPIYTIIYIISGVVGKTIVGAHQTITTGVVTSAIGAVNYSSEGGLSFSTESFTSGVTSSLKGALTGAVGTFTGGMMSQLNLGDSLSKVTGFSSDNVKSMQKLNDTIGGLAGQAVGFAMGDDFKFNLLNIADFGADKNLGLLELSIGRNGVSAGLGTGGLDMSVGTIASAVSGAVAWDVNNKINATAKASKMDIATVLRYQYGMGDSTQKDQLFSVLAGTTELRGSAGVNGEQAETVTADGKRVVTLAGYKAGMSAQEQMMLAINLGHEAYRDGVVGPDNVLETRDAARGHTEMALRMAADTLYTKDAMALIEGNQNLYNDVKAYGNGADAFNAYVDGNYDSSADYWKVTVSEGNIYAEWDGTRDITLPDGTVIKAKGSKEKMSAGQLAYSLFNSDAGASEIEALFNEAGSGWNGEAWVNSDGQAIGKNDQFGINITDVVSNSNVYNNQFRGWLQNGMDGVMLEDVGGLPDGLFGYVNRTRLLNNIGAQTSVMIGGAHSKVGQLDGIAETLQYEWAGAAFSEQYSRMYQAFVGHIGGSIAPNARTMTFSDDFAKDNTVNYPSKLNGKSVHTGGDTKGSVVGTEINAGFSGRIPNSTFEQNPLQFSDLYSATRSVVTMQTGFEFGNKFISTGVWLQYRHMDIPEKPVNTIFSSSEVLGKLGAVWFQETIAAHLHVDIVTQTSSNDSNWFKNLFSPKSESKITWEDGNDTYNRTYWSSKNVWDNYWKTAP